MKMLHCQSLKEIGVSTPAENRVGNSSVRKEFDRLESSSRVILIHVIENDVNVCKQISSLYFFRHIGVRTTEIHQHGVFILGSVNFWETFTTNI